MKIHFEQIGDGQPIVLLHAFPLSNAMWKPQIEAITSNNFRLILPDFRGFGKTPLNFSADLEDFAEDIKELLEDLGIKKAIFGGLSMGGYVLFNLYRLFPELFSAIILADTTYARDTEERRNGRFKLIEKVKKDDSKALIGEMLPNLTGDWTKANNPQLIEKLKAEFAEVSAGAVINALEAMANRQDHTEILRQINVPTLIIFGEDDKIINFESAEKMTSNIAGAKLIKINNPGHYSNLEQPEEFNTALIKFLKSINT